MYKKYFSILVVFISFLIVFSNISVAQSDKRQFSNSTSLINGYQVAISIIGSSSEDSRITSVINQMLETAQAMDVRINGSSGIISKINELGSGNSIILDNDTFELISKSKNIAAITNGWFDITAPSKKSYMSAKDYRKIKLNNSDNSFRFKSGGMKIDVSGVWPGFLVDKLLSKISGFGFKDVMVQVGSVSRNIGRDIHTPWGITIDIPNPDSNYAHRSYMYSFSDRAAALLSPGKLKVTLIDPKSKNEVGNNFRDITVFAQEAMTAQAMALAIYTIGPKGLLAFLYKHPEIKGVFVDNEGNFEKSKDMEFNMPDYSSESDLPVDIQDRGPNDIRQKKKEEAEDN